MTIELVVTEPAYNKLPKIKSVPKSKPKSKSKSTNKKDEIKSKPIIKEPEYIESDNDEKEEDPSKLNVRRKGVYFYEKSIKFPKCMLGKYCIKTIRLCNNTHSKVRVKVISPKAPFEIKQQIYIVRPYIIINIL